MIDNDPKYRVHGHSVSVITLLDINILSKVYELSIAKYQTKDPLNFHI